MPRVIKLVLIVVLGMVALAAAAVLALFLLVTPDRYKPAIETLFARQTGLQLNIAGDMSWSFRPVFGLDVNDLRLSAPSARSELASLSSVSIRVEPWALLDGRLEMHEFHADGLHINWIVNAQGVSNWQLPESADGGSAPAPATATPDDGSSDIAASIQRITVSNTSANVQDAYLGINATLRNLSLSSSDTNVENRPFPFELNFTISTGAGRAPAPAGIASTATIDMAAGTARFDDLLLKLNPLQLSGDFALHDFHNAPAWQGELSSNVFSLNDFLDLHVREPMAAPAAGPATMPGIDQDSDQFSMQLSFNGDGSQLHVPTLSLQLDDMRLDADAHYTPAADDSPASLRYNVAANALDLNPYTGTEEPAAATSPSPAPASSPSQPPPAPEARDDIELPIELLTSMNVQGSHRIESLAFAGWELSAINATLSVQDGRLNFGLDPAGFYNGTLTTTTSLDARQNPPVMTSISSLRNVNVAAMAQALPAARFAQGSLNVESIATLRGDTVHQLLDSLNGTTSFSVANSAVDISLVKQAFSAMSVLSPTGSSDISREWPDTVRFDTFEGYLTISDGLDNQQLQTALDNFEVSASGGIDLTAEEFDYDVVLTVFGEPAAQTIPISSQYQGIGWPVTCNARFDANPSQYCGPDFGKVRDLFLEIARDAVQRRVQERLEEAVPEQLQDAARSLLDNLLR